MLLTRFIPCLLLKNEGLVKTVNFRNPSYVGDPINTIRIFNEKEVDELILLDIEASPNNQEPNYKLLTEIANECFMPLAYGGGIRTFEQAQRIFSIGIEKVAINTAAHKNPDLISQIVTVYGSQAVVGAIDVKKNLFGKYGVVSNSGNSRSKHTPVEWLKILEDAGVGEVLLTNVNREGTWAGMDFDLIREISESSKVPVIAQGGAGSIDDLVNAIKIGRADAVAMGSMVVYQKKGFGVLVNFPDKTLLEKRLKE
ncbi:MAG: imidazole glycerol phosphate synthase subunit HisF [Bacteroidetes bacterium]|nr:imidazole glycerol phosphate synthase subunit HisF [Bacteroidota bacterium]